MTSIRREQWSGKLFFAPILFHYLHQPTPLIEPRSKEVLK